MDKTKIPDIRHELDLVENIRITSEENGQRAYGARKGPHRLKLLTNRLGFTG